MSESPRARDAVAESDPFEEFNRRQGQGQGGVRDLYGIFRLLRQQGPLQRIAIGQFTSGRQQMPGTPAEVYVALSHEAVSEVLRDGRRFSSAGYVESVGKVMGHTILEMDEPEHTTYRKLLQQAFTRKALEHWEHAAVRPVVHACIDAFAQRGRADLVRELTFPFPVTVIARMIGIPAADQADFHRWAIELISLGFDVELAKRAGQKLGGLFQRIIDERRAEPCDDLVSVLVQAEVDGQRLSDDLIVSFLRLLAPAGAETTYRSSSNLLFGLLTHTDQLDALRRNRGLMPQAIEEGLRWEAPLPGIMRRVTEDTTVAGVPVPAGAMLGVNLGAANRDESRYENPDAFDIFRPPKQHMAFAFGPHRCLGMHLARIETQVAMEAVLDRLPNLRLDPEATDIYISGMSFRSPLELPVVFGPA
jgi:cytochrome P450